MKSSNVKETNKKSTDVDTREKIKLMFDSPYGYHRQVLAGIDSHATNGIDLGYDAALIEDNKEDMFWVVNDEKLVIQAVNNFNDDQKLPLGVKIYQQGEATIKIDTLQNIPNNLNIYIHDIELDITHNLKESDYNVYLSPGLITDRFEIIFEYTKTLSSEEPDAELLNLFYSNEDSSIVLYNPNLKDVKSAQLFNVLGQSIYNFENIENVSYQKFKTKRLNPGTYILKLYMPNNTVSKKVLIK